MNWILAVPIEVRLVAAFVVGACLGAMANWAAIRFAWEPRGVNPWIVNPQGIGRRRRDRIPIVGWFLLRNETIQAQAVGQQQPEADVPVEETASERGEGESIAPMEREPVHVERGFWVRPFVVELLSALGVALLYWWEVVQGGLLPVAGPPHVLAGLTITFHMQWFCHTVLAWLMLAASLIDADEKLIPDEITVPGTLFGLTAAAIYPFALLPVIVQDNNRLSLDFLHTFSPYDWPHWLDGFPHGTALVLALVLWWLWCVALMDRPLYLSWGWGHAMAHLCSRLLRSPSTWRLVKLGLLGSAAIVGIWFRGGANWTGLLASLIGLAAGGGLIWMVRVIGAVVLQREAMGFGDVILLSMIGTLVGWQSCVVIFFLAPVAGLVLGLFQLVLRRENEIPYGPFLCLASMVLIVAWRPIWNWIEPTLLVMGWIAPLLVAMCLPAMALLLWLWRLLRELLLWLFGLLRGPS